MSNRTIAFFGLALLGVAVIWVIWFKVLPWLSYSGPRVPDTPFNREFSRICKLSTHIAEYAETHKGFPGGKSTGKTIEGLVGAGIISIEDAAYISAHHIKFLGFDPADFDAHIVVFETVFTNTTTPIHIVWYSDGSVNFWDEKR
jgi:hypothetical protein